MTKIEQPGRAAAVLPPMATPRVAAGVLYRDDRGRVLVVHPTYKEHWDIPGGYVEPGESPLAAARREVIEELGAPLTVGRFLLVDWAPAASEGDKLLFVFDGGAMDADTVARVVPDGNEISHISFETLDSMRLIHAPS
jgi:8-oxo-dGTP diphosphatase